MRCRQRFADDDRTSEGITVVIIIIISPSKTVLVSLC
jgi:hypothetical protein